MRNILVLLLCFLVSSCGFRPLYQNGAIEREVFQQIEVKSIDSVAGAEFYGYFTQLTPSYLADEDKKYLLDCHVDLHDDYNVLQSNADIFRKTVIISVDYRVIDKKTKEVLFSDKFSRFSAYNTTSSPYNNYSLKQNIVNGLAISAAREVHSRIVHFFVRSK